MGVDGSELDTNLGSRGIPSAVVQPSSRHRGGREEVGVMHIRPY